MALDFLNLVQNTDATIFIYTPYGDVIGFIDSDYNINGSNQWSSLSEQSLTEMMGKGAAQTVAKIASAATGIYPRSLWQSTQTYTGSAPFSFTMNITLVAFDPGIDVVADSLKLIKGVFPEVTDTGTMMMTAPYGYKVVGGIDSGTISVRIGNWFYADKQLLENVNFTFSKEIGTNGKPLYATGTIVFKPYRSISGDEMAKYFI